MKGWKEDHNEKTKVGIELADAITRVGAAILANTKIADEKLRGQFMESLQQINDDLSRFRKTDAQYLNQVGGAFNLIAAEAIIGLGNIVESLEDLEKIGNAYHPDMAFFHVPGGKWRVAENKFREKHGMPPSNRI